MNHQAFETIYHEDAIAKARRNVDLLLKEAGTLADRQVFAMPRHEVTVQFKERLALARKEIETIEEMLK